LPVLGNVFGMAGDLRGFLLREYQRHGPIFRVRALNLRWVALVGPEANVLADRISATHFRTWEQYHQFGAALGAHRVLLSMDGPEHIRMRRLLIKGYSPKMLESNLDLAHDVTLRAIEGWPQGRPIEIQRAMQQIITEQIGMFCTGLSSEKYFDDLLYFLKMNIQVNITKRLPKVMERLPKYRRARRRMQAFYERIMEAHRPEMREGKPPDFVDVLLEGNQANPQLLPETDLLVNVLAPYLVGMDTAASVCAFMLYALLKHPEILERMREEVDDMYAEYGSPTPAGMRKLDVTHRVALETLRMYPVVPALTRTVSNSFEFGGYRVPAGTEIMLGTTVGHHLPDYFPEPEQFDIERYSRSRAEHKQPGAFAPFGVGQHRCIGSGLSELQIALTLAAIVRKADLELERPERPLKIKLSPAPHPDDSVRMRLVHRRGD
ncbi:MAG: cytochrome P450, partial [Caldilineaceae bacterium]|nr:cytochrome P450 [Caldilineaceae bacterium]